MWQDYKRFELIVIHIHWDDGRLEQCFIKVPVIASQVRIKVQTKQQKRERNQLMKLLLMLK